MMARRPLIAGNWKMNGLKAAISELDRIIAGAAALAARTDLPVCPPATLIIAYEPVWAIGTGATPTPADAAEVHGFIRNRLAERYGGAGEGMRILYGGSVKPSNAKDLMTAGDVDGALVGGASLKADEFL